MASAAALFTAFSTALRACSAGPCSLAQAASRSPVSTTTLRTNHGFNMTALLVAALGCRNVAISGNAKLLADTDQVGIFERVPIRLEDLRIEIAVAVVVLGDLPQRLALLHLMPLRVVPRVLRLLRHARPPSSRSRPRARWGC